MLPALKPSMSVGNITFFFLFTDHSLFLGKCNVFVMQKETRTVWKFIKIFKLIIIEVRIAECASGSGLCRCVINPDLSGGNLEFPTFRRLPVPISSHYYLAENGKLSLRFLLFLFQA